MSTSGNFVRPGRIEHALGTEPAGPPRVLLVANSASHLGELLQILSADDIVFQTALGQSEALSLAQSDAGTPDLLVVSTDLPDEGALVLVHLLRATPGLLRLPVLFVGPREGPLGVARCLGVGWSDFAPTPLEPRELRARVRHQHRLQRALAEQRAQSQGLHALLDDAHDFIEVHDADERLLYVNRALCAALDLPREALLGEPLGRWLCPAGDDDESGGERTTTGSLTAPAARTARWHLLLPNGPPRILEGGLMPLRPGPRAAVRGMFHDVTGLVVRQRALRAREAELERANASLAQALATRDVFVANVSHELRTPLTAILYRLEALVEAERDPTYRASLGEIQASSSHLLRIVNGLLDLARLRAGALRPEVFWVPVGATLRGVIQTLRPIADRGAVELRMRTWPPHLVVETDGGWLRQILLNLVSNAVQASPAGAQVVLFATHDAHGQLRIEVRDEGVGLTPEQQARMFDPFQRFGPASAGSGAGLGLALVAAQVRALRGQLAVQSVPGSGTRVTLELPARVLPEDAGAPPVSGAAATPRSAGPRPGITTESEKPTSE